MGLFNNQYDHARIRQSIANFIESRGTMLNGLVDCSNEQFCDYIKALRTDGDYDYVGEDLALAAADIYAREIHIYSATADTQIFKPTNVDKTVACFDPIKVAFFEPAHYMALSSSSVNNSKNKQYSDNLSCNKMSEHLNGHCPPCTTSK